MNDDSKKKALYELFTTHLEEGDKRMSKSAIIEATRHGFNSLATEMIEDYRKADFFDEEI